MTIFQGSPLLAPTMNGPMPPEPTWMSRETMPSRMADPELSIRQLIFFFGNRLSSSRCCLATSSGA